MALPAVRSAATRAQRLRVTKRRATALLGAVAVVWVIVTVFGHSTWTGYVQATAEASLVGGLADWFAVTALFRHPLGLPIPHTAIIAERKEQFGATLGEFIQESFLTADVVVARLRAAGVVDRVADWLADPENASRLADHAMSLVDLLRDEEVGETVAATVRRRLEAVDAASVAARALRYASEGGRYYEVLDSALRGLDRYLDAHGDQLRGRLGEVSPWWLPGAVEDRIFVRLLDGARAAIRDMIGQPTNPLRKDLDASIERVIRDLETSPDLRARADQLKREVLDQPELRQWIRALWASTKDQLRSDRDIRARLAEAIASTGERLKGDAALRARAEESAERAVVFVVDRFQGEIVDLVSGTIARWDTAETSRRLELLLGPDLQYIRINGTVVGGGAGLVLYTLSRVFR